jgi:hypothetical protein
MRITKHEITRNKTKTGWVVSAYVQGKWATREFLGLTIYQAKVAFNRDMRRHIL